MPTITHRRRKRQGERIITRLVDNSDVYNKTVWRKTSKSFLKEPENMFCVKCLELGRYTVATVTDHIKSIRMGGAIWDRSNWQPLCTVHHNQKSGKEAHSHFNKTAK